MGETNTIIGLYTNADHTGTLDDPYNPADKKQSTWFREQLTAADPNLALIVALPVSHVTTGLERNQQPLDGEVRGAGRGPPECDLRALGRIPGSEQGRGGGS